MMWIWLIPVAVVLYFLLERKGQKLPNWLWFVVAIAALPLLGMTFMHGFAGRGFGGMMGGYGGYGGYGMMGPNGMMGRRGGFGPGPGPGPGTGALPAPAAEPFRSVAAWVCLGLLTVAVAAFVYFLYKRSQVTAVADDEALQQLRLRLARGEVTADEFDALQQKLKG